MFGQKSSRFACDKYVKNRISGRPIVPSGGEASKVLAGMGETRRSPVYRQSIENWVKGQMEHTRASALLCSIDKLLLQRSRKRPGTSISCSGNAPKKVYRTCAGFINSRLLQSVISGTQKGKQVASSDRSVDTESLHSLREIQNGNTGINQSLSSPRRVGNIDRLDRCLLSHSDCEGTEEVLPVPGTRNCLPVLSNAFRAFYCPKTVYGTSQGVEEISDSNGLQPESVFGRLDKSHVIQTRGPTVSDKATETGNITRVSSKLREVESGSNSVVRLRGLPLQFVEGDGISHRGKSSENTGSNFNLSVKRPDFGKGVHVPDRTVVSNRETGPTREIVVKENPVAPETQLELFRLFGDPDHSSSESEIGFSVVGESTQSFGRISTASSPSRHPGLFGCVEEGLGRPLRKRDRRRPLVPKREASPYKYFGDESSTPMPAVLPSLSEGKDSIVSMRQFHGRSISSQAGGSKSVGTDGSHMASLHVGQSSQDCDSSQTYSRLSQRSSRSSVQKRTDSADRVVTESVGVQQTDKEIVVSSRGSVRDKRQSQASSVRKPNTGPTGYGRGRSQSGLDEVKRVCLSSNETAHRGSSEGRSEPMSHAADSSLLASAKLVLGHNSPIGGQTGKTSSDQDTAKATGPIPLRQECQDEKSVRLDDQFESLLQQGFSESVATRVCAPQRSSTRLVYSNKIKVFKYWTRDHGVDGSNPSIAQISDFFLYLFERKKLSPGTIQGYKSALTDYFPKLGISESAELSRLLTSFYRDKPRSSNSLVPWDLRVVLDTLAKPPYEPLSQITLKHLTYKTVFLVTLATGRRRGEIRALARDRIKWSESDGSCLLHTLPDFLSKNLKASDPSSSLRPIIIKSLKTVTSVKEDCVNCAVRALREYINRTDGNRNGKKCLFLSMISSDKEISALSISHWLKSVITDCYKIYNGREALRPPIAGQIKAHQVRGIASSWAAKGNVSISQIMDACFWKSHSTFTSFYLKDIYVDNDDCFTLAPFVAAQQVCR